MDELLKVERELVLRIHQIITLDKDCSEFNRLPGLIESLSVVRQQFLYVEDEE